MNAPWDYRELTKRIEALASGEWRMEMAGLVYFAALQVALRFATG